MTPAFPFWAGGFADHLHHLRTTLGPNLHQFELLFSPFIPRWRLAQQEDGAHSRDRLWNLRLVFWTFLWQVAQAGASCRGSHPPSPSRLPVGQPQIAPGPE
jgi:hypothetical protein